MPTLKINRRNVANNIRNEHVFLSETRFLEMLTYERKRSERNHKPFLLMLLGANKPNKSREKAQDLSHLVNALTAHIRETDLLGWYNEEATVGVLFPDLPPEGKSVLVGTIFNKLSEALQQEISAEQFSQISISFHLFPDDWQEDRIGGGSSDLTLYPDVEAEDKGREVALGFKRLMDLSISSLLLVLLLPLLLAIAAAIKLTSKGPVFFRQQRVGQHGRQFTFLKFRSMRVGNDASAHRQYVHQMIAGTAERIAAKGASGGVFKLANDNRVTAIGRFLRRTSLDELPQLINVLRGEMSLVGPRPPIPYELSAYQIWHRRRLLQVKPGITGLWQVKGRSRVSFDEMVRLDLQYAKRWSLWMDVKILLETPSAVLKGAY